MTFRGGLEALRDVVCDAFCLFEGEVRTARNVDETTGCTTVVDIQQRVVHRVFDHFVGLVLILRLADEHHRDAALIHIVDMSA